MLRILAAILVFAALMFVATAAANSGAPRIVVGALVVIGVAGGGFIVFGTGGGEQA